MLNRDPEPVMITSAYNDESVRQTRARQSGINESGSSKAGSGGQPVAELKRRTVKFRFLTTKYGARQFGVITAPPGAKLFPNILDVLLPKVYNLSKTKVCF